MRLTFPVPSSRVPVGGVAIIYEFAMALADRGHDVTLLHHELFGGDAVTSADEVEWFVFRDVVDHVFVSGHDSLATALPDADVFLGYTPEIESIRRAGLPTQFIQGWRMYPEEVERATFHAPCPKICVARWLIDIGVELGVPRRELVHVPLGLPHDRFRLIEPIEDRPPAVTFCYNPHPRKGPGLAIDVIEELHRRRPDVAFAAFGKNVPEPALPSWFAFTENPDPSRLVNDIYNGTSVFLCTSEVEGFGLTSLEAMACGAALVTTDNGGSREYAEHGRTALVSEPNQRDPLVEHVLRLLDHPEERRRLATAGATLAASMTWPRSAELMEGFLERYLADPSAFSPRPR